MANGNRRTFADCDEHIARLREQINDLRAERDRYLDERNNANQRQMRSENARFHLERENARLQGYIDRVREETKREAVTE